MYLGAIHLTKLGQAFRSVHCKPFVFATQPQPGAKRTQTSSHIQKLSKCGSHAEATLGLQVTGVAQQFLHLVPVKVWCWWTGPPFVLLAGLACGKVLRDVIPQSFSNGIDSRQRFTVSLG